MQFDRYTLSLPQGVEGRLTRLDAEKEQFVFTWQPGTVGDGKLEMTWLEDARGICHQWYPGCGFDRGLRTDWYGPVECHISRNMPLTSFLDYAGMSVFTFALSDAQTCIRCSFGVNEETARLAMHVSIPLASFDRLGRYAVVMHTSRIRETLAQAADRVRPMWEAAYPPIPVPEDARLPLYSAWYSYHQATIAQDLEEECLQAASLGLKTIIVDDGWQTSDSNRGYAYCGDWEPAAVKIPDMKAHVARVHDMGMKYMLWYSVPFIGIHSRVWQEYRDMLLYTRWNGDVGVLDPRYPQVRQYLIQTYCRALTDWDLDGFKLDFIDSFAMQEGTPDAAPGMDIPVLADAVDRLMKDVRTSLSQIKPDILLEFRQQYVGPLMRTFGNMFRVGDCPMCPDKNRVGMFDLRMTCGNSAVHSDMLMWDPADTPENAMRQLLNVLYCVPQISMRIAQLPRTHRQALKFWLDFIRDHRDILQDAPLEAALPQYLYPWACAGKDGRYVLAVYAPGQCLKVPEDAREVYIVNATDDTRILLAAAGAEVVAETWNVLGESQRTSPLHLDDPCCVRIPVCGLLHWVKK